MTKMTKKEALSIALSTMTNEEAKTVIEGMITQLSKSRSMSDEAKTKANEKRKAATATARATLIDEVAPVLRKYLTTPVTAKELYEVAKTELPADFSWNKVQNILIREMKPELFIVEAKGKANTYCIKG